MASLAERVSAPDDANIDWADNTGLDGATELQGGGGGVNDLLQPEFDVEVKLIDPDSPLYSVKSFEELGLSEELLKGILKLNFRTPSKIQEKALPLLISNPPRNLIGQSQSGTGKTAAFTLNILSRVDLSSEQAQNTPQALILAPTRELARQIMGVVQSLGEFMTGLRVAPAIPTDPSVRGQPIRGSVVVGTPGTTMDLIRKRSLDISKLRVLVLDEADNMLDQQGMGEQCMRVKNMLPKNLQIVLFSATFPEKVINYAKLFAPQANELTLKAEELTVEGIKQLYLDCSSEEHKYEVLVKLYGMMTIGSSIIFVKRRDTATEIERRMTAEGHKVVSLTGAFEGAQRDAVIDAFRESKAKVLITTNVLARGIDVQSVNLVINYDIPDDGMRPPKPDPQTYLHRIGRTGRYGRVGAAISFVHNQQSWQMLSDIAKEFGVTMERVETSDWDEVEVRLTRILKSRRAQADFKPELQQGAAMD